jgi:hypothetical protein
VGVWSVLGVGEGSVATGSAVDDDDELVLVVEVVSWLLPPVLAGVPVESDEPPVGEPWVGLVSAGAVARGSSANAAGATAARLATAISPAQTKLLKVAANRTDFAKERPGSK